MIYPYFLILGAGFAGTLVLDCGIQGELDILGSVVLLILVLGLGSMYGMGRMVFGKKTWW